MKILAKLGSHLRKIGKKGKAFLCTSLAIATTAALSVFASAAESGAETAPDMDAVLASAGTQLTSSFNSLVSTMIPVILGILGSGLVIFGLFALIKLAKKVFGKVAS